jgi:hypothetical protein
VSVTEPSPYRNPAPNVDQIALTGGTRRTEFAARLPAAGYGRGVGTAMQSDRSRRESTVVGALPDEATR